MKRIVFSIRDRSWGVGRLGIGLSEGTAIIVTADRFEVMGKWMVAVHDNTRAHQPWEKPYFVLAPGDVYDMKARRILVQVE